MPSISKRLILQITGVAVVIISIAWYCSEPGFEPFIAVLGGIVALKHSSTVSDTPISIPTSEKTKSAREERNRQDMLELVRNSWVKGVLERSLNDEVLIELGLEERRDAVYNRQGMELQRTGKPNRLLPPGTKVIDVFDEMGQTLLIMGEPGSGKTTLLLELARDTIARAEKDQKHRIPVVFNLSSWTDTKQPIADWLVDELSTMYCIPKKIAMDWVENDDLQLLLDGLDEVPLERREACAYAINDFRQKHGWTPLAVGCRSEEYKNLSTRLNLEGAVCLQSLTEKQVDDYLDRIGPELAALRTALKDDLELCELAKTPLMLSVMTLAYRGVSVHDLQPLETVNARRKHIFDNYVERMFKPRTQRTLPDYPETDSIPDRKNDDECFSKEETIHWLSWLAKRMSQYGQSVFLIERMQPDWLPTLAQRRIMTVGVGGTIGLLIGGVSGLLIGVWLPPFGLFAIMLCGLIMGQFIELNYVLTGDHKAIHPVETLQFSWPTSITLALGVGLLTYLSTSLQSMSVYILLLFFGLHGAVSAGLTKSKIDIRTIPNEGILLSARNAVYAFLLFGPLLGLSFALLTWLVPWALWLPRPSIVFVLVLFATGLPAGLHYGGHAYIQHRVLRIMLWRNGSAPLYYVHFLNYAADRIFLRKVGGGYIFVHRLLLEYFASLEPEEEGG